MRSVLLATVGVVLAAFLAADRSPQAAAAEPDLAGNWIFAYLSRNNEVAICMLKVDTKDNKPVVSGITSFPSSEQITVTDSHITATRVDVTVKRVRKIMGREFTELLTFNGVRGKDPKVILGSVGSRSRAKLIATDREKLKDVDELIRSNPIPEPMTKVQQLTTKVIAAQNKMFREKDAEKRKELQEEFVAARKELEEKQPDLYREVVAKHADNPAALDAALALINISKRIKMTAEEAERLVKLVQKQAGLYGPVYATNLLTSITGTLVAQKGLEPVALLAIEPAAKALTQDDSAALQTDVLSLYKLSVEKTGKDEEAKALEPRIAALETKIDAEYLKKVPPFKPTPFAGRKDKSANRVAVMELFTGAQCPPCVAADVAFDALEKSYKPTDLVLLQYHLHIPGPDPLTNTDTLARAKYYGVNSTPNTFFNGKAQAGGGGGMTNAERKYKQYADIIDPLLEKSGEIKMGGKASRTGNKLDIAVEVANGDDMKLRILVVEETVKYVGGNTLRFHHHVVRAMPTGNDGVAIKDKTFKHTVSVDLDGVRKNLTKYLDEYAATRPFRKPDRPMDMKALKVIALVQNDDTKEIVQAVQIEIEGRTAGGQ